MDFSELIAGFGAKFNVDDLTPDAEGVVEVSFDDFVVSFHCAPMDTRVMMVAELGEVPPDGKEFIQSQLLEANYLFLKTSGATLSLNPEGGCVTLCRSEPLDWLDVERFTQLVEGFVNDLSVWKGLLNGYGAIDGEVGRICQERALEERQFALGGFIRV